MNFIPNLVIFFFKFFRCLIINIPVPMIELEILMFWVLVIWIPSVLGLFPGDDTLRPEALTLIESWNETWICCAFCIVKFSTIKSLQLSNVRAYKNKVKLINKYIQLKSLIMKYVKIQSEQSNHNRNQCLI